MSGRFRDYVYCIFLVCFNLLVVISVHIITNLYQTGCDAVSLCYNNFSRVSVKALCEIHIQDKINDSI